jgi:DNA-binding transcriptional ArsR family regulator
MESMSGPRRRAATPEEARALAHPLRLRILRLCLDTALTNKQLSERLGKDPGTVLHHVRTLVATGFLAAEEVRQGQSGALEKPYRATGKSWTLDVGEEATGEAGATEAMLEAFLTEFREGGSAAAGGWSRLALTLGQASLEELQDRLQALLDEFVDRSPEPAGEPYGMLVVIHRRAVDPAAQVPGSGEVSPTS